MEVEELLVLKYMILEYGDISALRGKQWFMMELRSEKTVESTMKRVGKALHGIFRNEPVEIFLPVTERDLDVFTLATGPYVFVRSTSFSSLLRLKQITGVVSLVTEGESNRPSKAIPVEDTYVQELITKAENEHRNQAIGIEVGSFVRILNGETRDFCGTVEIIGDGRAVVRVTLRTKSILLETPIRNLLNLSHVPPDQRVYYYCPLVSDLSLEENGLHLIEEDLQLDDTQAEIQSIEDQPSDEPKRHSRQRTVTALVKKLVLIENQHDPMEIARTVISALKKKEIKNPKNLFIVYCIIKDLIMREYFLKLDPNLRSYREVVKKFGRQYKFSANQIAKIDPDIGIPIQTQEVCKDGRSREARQKFRKAAVAELLNVTKQRQRRRLEKKKLPNDKCGECGHERQAHKISPKGAWARCLESSKSDTRKGLCFCKRFKEKKR